MIAEDFGPELRAAIQAAQAKQATALTVLDMENLGAFTDAFLLCTGFSAPQIETIADFIEEQLRKLGVRPLHREGRKGAEWILVDYGRFVVHVFSERQRLYYDLERLWRNARRIDIAEPEPGISAAGGRNA